MTAMQKGASAASLDYQKLIDLAHVSNSSLVEASSMALLQLGEFMHSPSRLEHFLSVKGASTTNTPQFPLEADFRLLATKLGLECYSDEGTTGTQTLSFTGKMLVIDITLKAGIVLSCSVVLANPDGSQQELDAGKVLLGNLRNGETTLAAVNLERLARLDRLASQHLIDLHAQQADLHKALLVEIPEMKLNSGRHVGISVAYLEAHSAANICYTASLEVHEQAPSKSAPAFFPEDWRRDTVWTSQGDAKVFPTLRYALVLDPPIYFFDPPTHVIGERVRLQHRKKTVFDSAERPIAFDIRIDASDLFEVTCWPIAHPQEVAGLVKGVLRAAAVQTALIRSLEGDETINADQHISMQCRAGQMRLQRISLDQKQVNDKPVELSVRVEQDGKLSCTSERSKQILEAIYNLPISLLDQIS